MFSYQDSKLASNIKTEDVEIDVFDKNVFYLTITIG